MTELPEDGQGAAQPIWRFSMSHHTTTHLVGARNLGALHACRNTTALCIEYSQLADLQDLTTLTSLLELQLIGCDIPSLDVIPSIKNLRRVAIVGCGVQDARPLLHAASLSECVLRAVPWSSRSWEHDIPRLKSKKGLSCMVASIRDWTVCAGAWQVCGACAELVDDDKVMVMFPGIADNLRGSSVVARRPVLMALTTARDPQALESLARTDGQNCADRVYEAAAAVLFRLDADYVLSKLDSESLSTAEAAALRQYVRRFPDLEYFERPRSPTVAALRVGTTPRVLAAFAETIGPWNVGSSQPEVQLSLGNAGPQWWSWHPDGAWDEPDSIADDGVHLFPIAMNADLERALWVQVGPGDRTPVLEGSIDEHGPGAEMHRSTLAPVAPSLPALLNSILAIRFPDGSVVEGR